MKEWTEIKETEFIEKPSPIRDSPGLVPLQKLLKIEGLIEKKLKRDMKGNATQKLQSHVKAYHKTFTDEFIQSLTAGELLSFAHPGGREFHEKEIKDEKK